MWIRNRILSILVRLLLPTVLLSLLSCGDNPAKTTDPACNVWLPITEDVNGSLTETNGIPILTVWGTFFEQGYAHGYLYAPEIIHYAELSLQQEGMVELYENLVIPNIDKYVIPAEYLLEMDGLLAGMEARAKSGSIYLAAADRALTINDVIATSCIDNIEQIVENRCTSFCVWDTITVNSTPLVGRNMDDWDDEINTGRYILIVRKSLPESGIPNWVSISLPGGLDCTTGMNSEGVTLARHQVEFTRDISESDGFCPEDLLYRKLLESARPGSVVEDVSSVLQDLYTNGGEAILMSWPSGHGSCSAVFEVDGDLTLGHGFTVRQPETGFPYLIQTNQFYERLLPSNSYRYTLIKNRLDSVNTGEQSPLTIDAVWETLGQVPSSEELIIQYAVVFQPNEMLMHLAFAEPGTHAPSCQRITVDVSQLLE